MKASLNPLVECFQRTIREYLASATALGGHRVFWGVVERRRLVPRTGVQMLRSEAQESPLFDSASVCKSCV